MFCKMKKIIFAFILIFTFLFTSIYVYAAEDSPFVPFDQMTEEELAAYVRDYEINFEKAKQEVEYPPVCNLPSLLKQPTFHPNEGKDDLFGETDDTTPIFRVSLYKDPEKKRFMSLTFDSAYINKYTYDILDVLDEYDVKATFFMTYEFMRSNPKQIMEIISRGHEIGNHTTTHPDLNLVDDFKVVREVMKCNNYLKKLTGVEMSLFRYPYGSYSPRTVKILKKLGFYPIQWTFDSIDWRNEPIEVLTNRFMNSEFATPGCIVLMHNGADHTAEALPTIIEYIESQNLKCVRVSDLIYKHDFTLTKNGMQVSNTINAEEE